MKTTVQPKRTLPAVVTAPPAPRPSAATKRRPPIPTGTDSATQQPAKRAKTSITVDDTSSIGSTSPAAPAEDSKTQPEQRKGLFAGCRIVIFHGADITPGRYAILAEQIGKRGGDVASALDRRCTHIIVPVDYKPEHYASWQRTLKPRHLDRIEVKRVDWLVDALRKNALSTDSRYDVDWRKTTTGTGAEVSAVSRSQRELFPEITSIPDSPPWASPASASSQPPPLSPALSQQAAETPPTSPARPAALVRAERLEPSMPAVSEEETPALSIPDTDEEDEAHVSAPELLIDPSVLPAVSKTAASPYPLPALSTPSQSVLPVHPYYTTNKHKLACQLPSMSLVNHNTHITAVLERLEEMNAGLGDKWRTYSYRKAVGIVKQWPRRVTTEKDLEELGRVRGIGESMLSKVREVVATGRLTKVDIMERDERVQTMERFSKIHGVGGATAARWYAMGLRTLNDLVTSPLVQLTPQQALGLKFYEDKQRRIPRPEVAAIEEWVRQAAEALLPGVRVICCGSYRRGKPSSGDVDLLVAHEDFTDDGEGKERRKQFTHLLMQKLHGNILPPFTWKKGVKAEADKAEDEIMKQEEQDRKVKDEHGGSVKQEQVKADAAVKPEPSRPPASSSSSSSSLLSTAAASSSVAAAPGRAEDELPLPPFISGSLAPFDKLTSKHAQANFMGFCSLPVGHPQYSGINRRLDIKVYPLHMFPFALLYFTGSDHFNRSMRFYARKCGWTLSDHGLQPAQRVGGLGKVWIGDTLDCKTEKDIFEAMGLTYVPPTERNTYIHFDITVAEVDRMKREEEEEEADGAAAYNSDEAGLIVKKEESDDDEHDAKRMATMEPEDAYR